MSARANRITKDTWVVQIRGRYRGRVGRVCRRPTFRDNHVGRRVGEAVVQFGAGGPIETYGFSSLRKADADEIPHGVG